MSILKLSNFIQQVKPSPTLAAGAKANELKAQGKDIVSFTLGEPDFDTPDHVKRAAIDAMDKGFTKYTATEGVLPLRQAIVDKMKRDQNLDYSTKQVIVTCGGKHAISGLMAVMLNPGDEVIIPSPYWTSYPDMTALFGATSRIVPTLPEKAYVLQPEQLEASLTEKTKMLILNSPSNPTGACYTEEDLKALAEVLRRSPFGKNVCILSDEVYEYITYQGYRHVSLAQVAPDLKEQIVIANAFSKAYSMTGWRVGYAVASESIIKAMVTHQSQFTSNICSVAQYAAAKAYEDNYEFPRRMLEAFNRRLEIVNSALANIQGLELAVQPLGAFYAFLRIEGIIGRKAEGKEITCSQTFTDYLLNKYLVATVQGEAFGDPSAFRVSFALSDERLKEGLSRLQEAVASLE